MAGRPPAGAARRHFPAQPQPQPPQIEPFVPVADQHNRNPRELKSWARRTGFRPFSGVFSGESSATTAFSGEPPLPPPPPPPQPEIDGDHGRRRRRERDRGEVAQRRVPPLTATGRSAAAATVAAVVEDEDGKREEEQMVDLEKGGEERGRRRRRMFGLGLRREEREESLDRELAAAVNGMRDGSVETPNVGRDAETRNKEEEKKAMERKEEEEKKKKAMERNEEERKEPRDEEIDTFWEEDNGSRGRSGGGAEGRDGNRPPSDLRCGITENPGWAPLIFYGLQQYLSIAGSLVFMPLIMVPNMGGTDGDTATVISTMLLITGVTTILHTFFGSRLPLIQGSSFVYLAPALVIANSQEFRDLGENKFKHIMRELQGAVIIGSIFQIALGYSGLMSLLLRFINPVVVAPTVAAIGLAYFGLGFPQAGSCVEIGFPLIILILLLTLYLRKISIFGNRVFLIYAVPLTVAIIWAYAFFLTMGGAYNYKGCSSNVPSSNILLDSCRRRALTMKNCRTDVSNAWKSAAWVRVPYPFQWGAPTFHFKTSIIMVFISLVASVDSVSSYHATSSLVNLSPPTPGIVSRGIGLEGLTSMIAGLWGTGAGCTTLTENVHTIDATKMANRTALQFGAAFLVLFSFFGKIGALLASIPIALAASILCFTWALIVALGFSILRYTQAGSSRNIIILGFTLFISLSLPAYVQQYEPLTNLVLPSYLIPYAAASDGPIRTHSSELNYALNGLFSINSVVALLVAFILDNTVPGSQQERGVYIWSDACKRDVDPATLEPYRLPEKIAFWFRWARCIGS